MHYDASGAIGIRNPRRDGLVRQFVVAASIIAFIHAGESAANAASFPSNDAEPVAGPDNRENAAVSALVDAAATFVTEAPDFDALVGSMAEVVAASKPVEHDEVRARHEVRKLGSDRGTLTVHVWATPASHPEKFTIAITFEKTELPSSIRSRFTRIAMMKAVVFLDKERSPTLFADVLLVPSSEALRASTPVLTGYSLGLSEAGDIVLVPQFANGGVGAAAMDEQSVGVAPGKETVPVRTDPTRLVDAARHAVDRHSANGSGMQD